MNEIVSTAILCFNMTIVGLSLGFVLLWLQVA